MNQHLTSHLFHHRCFTWTSIPVIDDDRTWINFAQCHHFTVYHFFWKDWRTELFVQSR